MSTPEPTNALRTQIAQALRERINQAPQRPTLDGPPGHTEIGVGMTDLADAVLEVVQPELDRLHEAEDRLSQIAGAVERSTARADETEAARDRWKTRAELAEAAVARVRRLSRLTIDSSMRLGAIDQATDTLKALDQAAKEGE